MVAFVGGLEGAELIIGKYELGVDPIKKTRKRKNNSSSVPSPKSLKGGETLTSFLVSDMNKIRKPFGFIS